MEKIPCIECTPELWEYIKPYLEKWGYYTTFVGGKFDADFHILILNWNKDKSCYGFGNKPIAKDCMAELVDNVEEFLERASKLKGFTYNRKDKKMEKEFTKADLKSGMVVKAKNNKMYLVVGDKMISDDGFMYLSHYNNDLKNSYPEFDIVEVHDDVSCWGRGFSKGLSYVSGEGKLLWKRKELKEYTMQEIADKLGIPVEELRIKK